MEFKDVYESVYMTMAGEQLRFQYDVLTGVGYLIVGGAQVRVEHGDAVGVPLHPLDRVWLNLVMHTAIEYKFMRDTYVSVRS